MNKKPSLLIVILAMLFLFFFGSKDSARESTQPTEPAQVTEATVENTLTADGT